MSVNCKKIKAPLAIAGLTFIVLLVVSVTITLLAVILLASVGKVVAVAKA